jgi:hypothetical protein
MVTEMYFTQQGEKRMIGGIRNEIIIDRDWQC